MVSGFIGSNGFRYSFFRKKKSVFFRSGIEPVYVAGVGCIGCKFNVGYRFTVIGKGVFRNLRKGKCFFCNRVCNENIRNLFRLAFGFGWSRCVVFNRFWRCIFFAFSTGAFFFFSFYLYFFLRV